MKLHEYKYAMSVMEGRKCIAVARIVGDHGWRLTLHGGSWTDPRARTQGLIPGKYPHLLLVKTRREARKILKELAA